MLNSVIDVADADAATLSGEVAADTVVLLLLISAPMQLHSFQLAQLPSQTQLHMDSRAQKGKTNVRAGRDQSVL